MRIFAGLCLAVLLASPGLAAKPKLPKAPAYVSEADRPAPSGRAAQIELGEAEIGTTVEIGRVADDYVNGGALDYMWYRHHDNKPEILTAMAQREAEVKVVPLRAALAGFDIEALALSTARAGLAKSGWFKAEPIEINRRPSPGSRLDFADVAPTGQVAFISCYYFMSHDFTQIEVMVDLTMGRKGKKKPEIFYFHRLASIVQLPRPAFDAAANVRSWSAEDGKLARSAITAAFVRMEQLIPRALDMKQAEVAWLSAKDKDAPNRESAQTAGRYGPLIERGQDGPGSLTIWSKGLVSVQQAAVN